MSILVVDASVIGSNLLPEETAHASSARFLTLSRERRQAVVFPLILLPELGAIIGRRLARPELASPLLRHLLRTDTFRLAAFDEAQAFAAAELAAHAGLRAADAVYAALARQIGATLVTLDRQQLARAASHVAVATPEEMVHRWQASGSPSDATEDQT